MKTKIYAFLLFVLTAISAQAQEVIEKQTALMVKAFKEVYALAVEYKVSMRVAAYISALSRITKAMKNRGQF